MYLHIGKNCVIRDTSVIGVFDLEKIEKTPEFKALFSTLEENGNIIDIANNQKNSFVLTKDKNKIKGYISNIGTSAIKKRKI
jgi:hypothetical protein